jgi:hypothetical protein
MNFWTLWKAFNAVLPIARPLVLAIVQAISRKQDPRAAARRALDALEEEREVDDWARKQGVFK